MSGKGGSTACVAPHPSTVCGVVAPRNGTLPCKNDWLLGVYCKVWSSSAAAAALSPKFLLHGGLVQIPADISSPVKELVTGLHRHPATRACTCMRVQCQHAAGDCIPCTLQTCSPRELKSRGLQAMLLQP